jgi:hypothetical protein
LNVRESAGRLGFGKVAITALVVFHACLGNERRSICQSPDDIGQIVGKSASIMGIDDLFPGKSTLHLASSIDTL